ncbi:MAG: sulfotransferase family 2 domain-containing protein [Paracoccaceae bacterium]
MSTALRPFDSFVIFSVMRSGSNLLERYLAQYDGLASFGELFNPVFIGRRGQNMLFDVSCDTARRDPAALLAAIAHARPETVNGLRYFPEHVPAALQVLLDDPRCAKVILTRDPLESYVSLGIAQFSDIWLIGSENDRLPLSVPVSPAAFKAYKATRKVYFDRIEAGLAASAQAALRINYADLGDIAKVNALAKALGATSPREMLETPIKRQNPAPLHAKIANYAEVYEALGLPAPESLPETEPLSQTESQVKWVWPRHYYVCDHRPLAFAPLIENTKQPLTAWLGLVPSELRTGLKLDYVKDWAARNQKAEVISVLHHPIDRLYAAFMNKIFSTAPDAFQKIRATLETRYQLYLPRDAQKLDRKTYTADDHRTAFHQFLLFVAANLQGETDIRQDCAWQTQSALADIFAQIMPITRFIRVEQLNRELPELERALDIPPIWATLRRDKHAAFAFDLAEIYTTQTETLARAAYGEDYARFGFGNWQPGYAAFDASLPSSA